MKIGLVLVVGLLALPGCAHERGRAQTLDELHGMYDWQYEPGSDLNSAYANDMRRVLVPMGREGALAALRSARYECLFGEAHDAYLEPAAQCTYSFATRACQMDWEVFLTSEPSRPGGIETLDTAFQRDCVGTDLDWPEKIVSEIDSQRAAAARP
ncbi:MAG: hypothetical protein ACK4Y9_12345 [Hyphomonas sp.]